MKDWAYQPEAQAELEDAVDWYEHRREGLGEELYELIVATLEKKKDAALPGSRVDDRLPAHLRRVLLPRFPYALVLDVREHMRLVVAVAHFKRRPGYWKKRLRSMR
jgi:hypothetical protein